MMNTLALLNETLGNVTMAFGNVVAGSGISESTGWEWLKSIRTFLVPFLLIAVAGISVTFLVRRQMSQFLQFIAISILVFVLIYSPEIIANVAVFLAGEAGQSTEGNLPENGRVGPPAPAGGMILPLTRAYLGF